jgi:hypothetical protein
MMPAMARRLRLGLKTPPITWPHWPPRWRRGRSRACARLERTQVSGLLIAPLHSPAAPGTTGRPRDARSCRTTYPGARSRRRLPPPSGARCRGPPCRARRAPSRCDCRPPPCRTTTCPRGRPATCVAAGTGWGWGTKGTTYGTTYGCQYSSHRFPPLATLLSFLSCARPSGEAPPVTDCSWSFRARGHVSFA